MAQSIRLFLIRHGETVDNVAQLYAGSRDSELTNHGFLQATRLGVHFQAIGLSFTHLFSSHLQRAAKTAGKIREAQLGRLSEDGLPRVAPEVVQLPLLMEQDFGSLEGKKWYDRPPESKGFEGKPSGLEGKDTAEFVDMESKESVSRRADTFLDEHLQPLLDDASMSANPIIAIVSHGIFLSTLWKRLLLRLSPKSVKLSSELQAIARPSLKHLDGWSNTSYLELQMIRTLPKEAKSTAKEHSPPVPEPSSLPDTDGGIGKISLPLPTAADNTLAQTSIPEVVSSEAVPVPQSSSPRLNHGWVTTVLTINGKDHLKGLKRTGGGVGSSRHDTSQKSIDTFFKRRMIK